MDNKIDFNRLRKFKKKYPISYLAVFGSYSRNEQKKDSDLVYPLN
ncbi:MAG: hypothetical protein DRH57_07005 [Candidatus Cloacimonadota bacterium]|nr:MAG: hypothetical protein DRH57_07005 [Candidatus Cloacimonadota bacterium]